jgi:transposase-like protein
MSAALAPVHGTGTAQRARVSPHSPIASGSQPCPYCYAYGWITTDWKVTGERVRRVWKCSNCRHQWAAEETASNRADDRLTKGREPVNRGKRSTRS